MAEKSELVSRVLLLAEKNGFTEISPVELNDGGNLIIHLSPYPIVARISTAISEEDPDQAYKIQQRELQVANHLQTSGVPVLLPTDMIDAGPYDIGGTWMTLWQFETRVQSHLSPAEAVELVNRMSNAMKDYPGELPAFGVWDRTCQSAVRLREHPDQRVQALLGIFQKVKEKMRQEPEILIPCHGDANVGNLFPCNKGWIWMDFEDASLMPFYWDLASYVCVPALFRGIQSPILKYVLDQIDDQTNLKLFCFTLIVRTLTSSLGNLDYALIGHGDLDFALEELELAEDFIHQIELISKGKANR